MKSAIPLLCVTACILSFLFGLMAWLTPAVGPEAGFRWTIRISTVIAGPLSLLILFVLTLKPDPVPDFFADVSLPHFGRDGVLFAFEVIAKEHVCWLTVHYQNRFANRAVLTVAVQPSRDFLMSRNDIPSMVAELPCGPAAYGTLDIPLPIPQQYQGKKQSFDVAASIRYPKRTGALLRNSVGAPIASADLPGFGSLVLTVAHLVILGRPQLSFKFPTRIQLQLPTGVQETTDGLPDIVQDEKWVLPADFDIDAATKRSSEHPN